MALTSLMISIPPVAVLLHHINGLMQDGSISSTLAMEIQQSCTIPSISLYVLCMCLCFCIRGFSLFKTLANMYFM